MVIDQSIASTSGNFASTTVTFWTSAAATVRVGDVVVASASTAPVALNYGWQVFGLGFDLFGADIVYDSGAIIYFSIQTTRQAWVLSGPLTQDNQTGWSHLNDGKTGLALVGAAVRRRKN